MALYSSFSDLQDSAATLSSAVRRVAALAIVDASLALPLRANPACQAALGALALKSSKGEEFVYYRPSTGERPTALVVLCHPSDGPSMCRSLAEAWEEGLKNARVQVRRLDLGGSDHMGLGNSEELRASLTGMGSPAEVQRLQALVDESQFLIFVHPVFWFDVPSQLKGFQESVLSSGFAFRKLPGHWLLNRAAGVMERLPVVPRLMRRYAAYGMLRDKRVFVTRTQGGPAAGMGIFGHEATSLESSVQFCGAHLSAVDRIAELDDTSPKDLAARVLPEAKLQIAAHCQAIARLAAASVAAQPGHSVCHAKVAPALGGNIGPVAAA